MKPAVIEPVVNKPSDSSNHHFWDIRFAAGKTPWDFRGIPAALDLFLKTCPTIGKVLIPGCGRGYEVQAFHQSGWKVTAIDFSPVAVDQERTQLGKLARFVIFGDFFKYDLGKRRFDLVYERTFLCALPPRLWQPYVDRMVQLLRPGGRLVGFFLYGEATEPPPYPLSEARARDLFETNFSLMRRIPAEDSLPLFGGQEYWQEWRLKT
jgi:SAM-dependent methyltransferase